MESGDAPVPYRAMSGRHVATATAQVKTRRAGVQADFREEGVGRDTHDLGEQPLPPGHAASDHIIIRFHQDSLRHRFVETQVHGSPQGSGSSSSAAIQYWAFFTATSGAARKLTNPGKRVPLRTSSLYSMPQ